MTTDVKPGRSLVASLLAAGAFAGSPLRAAALEAGPENHGLRLKLSISTTRRQETDVHAVRVELANVGSAAVTLVAHWPYEELKGNYAEFLKSRLEFLTFPEVEPSGTQTAGSARASAQPKRELRPGQGLAVAWEAQGPWLKPNEVFEAANTSPHFPGEGLYAVRARVVLLTEAGKRILLTSNEQPVPIGGSRRMPKYATARLIEADPAKGTARIGLGSDHGLVPGDLFAIHYGLQAGWLLALTRVEAGWAEGTVKLLHHDGTRSVPQFPDKSWTANLVPTELKPKLAESGLDQRRSPAVAPTGRCRFGLFMPKEDVYSDTSDVNDRISRYLRGRPKDVPLAEYPVISEEDLVGYDWPRHTMTLRHAFWHRIRFPNLRGSPFVVVVDGEPVYVGAFYTDMSSFSCESPIIRFDDRMTNRVVRIDQEYPAPSGIPGAKDPRSDTRIKNVLQALGRLKS